MKGIWVYFEEQNDGWATIKRPVCAYRTYEKAIEDIAKTWWEEGGFEYYKDYEDCYEHVRCADLIEFIPFKEGVE